MSIKAPIREIPWADIAASEDIIEPSDVTKGTAFTGAQAALYRWFNWLHRQTARWIKYLRVRGIPDYSSSEDYTAGDRVQHTGGLVYRCIQANGPGTVKRPGVNSAYWALWPTDTTTLSNGDGIGVSTGSVGNICQATLPTVGSMNGWRCLSFKIVDVGNPSGYIDVTLQGAASIQSNSVAQVTYGDGFDPSLTQSPVIQQLTGDPHVFRIWFTNQAVTGSHPALNVTFTSVLP